MSSSGPGGHAGTGTSPLGRFRLLDLSRQLPGPFCSALLGDLRMVVEMEGPAGRRRLAGPPIELSRTPARIPTRPPGLGEHTDAVLAELGHSPAEIAALRAQGVV